jgi:hypothetical protein
MVIKQILIADYVQLTNEFSRLDGISNGAIGLLAKAMSYSNGYRVRINSLVTEYDTIDEVRKQLNQLCQFGYARLRVDRVEKGRFHSEYDFAQFPDEEWKQEWIDRGVAKEKLGKRKKREIGKVDTRYNLPNYKGDHTTPPSPTIQTPTKNLKLAIDVEPFKTTYQEVYQFVFGKPFMFSKSHEKAIERLAEVMPIKHFKHFLFLAFCHFKKDHDKFMPAHIQHQFNTIMENQKVNRNRKANYFKSLLEEKQKAIAILDAKEKIGISTANEMQMVIHQRYDILVQITRIYEMGSFKIAPAFLRMLKETQDRKKLNLEAIKAKYFKDD